MQSLIIILLILFPISILGFLRYKQLKKRETLSDDDKVQDEVEEFVYNGRKIYLSESEKPAWNGLPRIQKRAIYHKQLKMLQKKDAFIVTDNNGKTGMITRAEAIRSGYLKVERK
jgi:predicted transcriptional regulator